MSGVVSAANSLVGSKHGDLIGYINPRDGVIPLGNGNYVVVSPTWSNGSVGGAGAVTWGDGTKGIKGTVSVANSLVGSTTNDSVGINGVIMLSNSNYVVCSPHWQNVAVAQAGAATWGNGATGVTGAVSATNSLVGSNPADGVGYTVTALSNGNYVVASPTWDNTAAASASAGAATWGNGATGMKGAVSAANSLVGSTPCDQVGSNGVKALSNGNYVVESPNWHNSAAANAGAATWGSGTAGVKGTVSAANSLVGPTAGDRVGIIVIALTNGNYVLASPFWHNLALANAGAATWGNGATGTQGAVSTSNSLVGSVASDDVGSMVIALTNGNYVVLSPVWHNAALVEVGAVTWGSGTAGVKGTVSAANSLVGATVGDRVGYNLTKLTNGNYVVVSPRWDNGAATDAGAVTWGSGTTGVKGVVSAANSLVGSKTDDKIGCADASCSRTSVAVLSNGNYVVVSPEWNNGSAASAGAVTWGNGASGVKGVVSSTNSLVGSTASDTVGDGGAPALSNGNYVVMSPHWHNGATAGAGAITAGCAIGSTTGPITAANSVRGAAAGGGSTMSFAYDPIHQQLVVGQPADNIVSLFAFSCSNPTHTIFLPIVRR